MQLIFTKGSGKSDKMEVVRTGVVAESVACPKQGIIPHDMVHFAVESTLRKRGFLARILDGEAASYQMGSEQESDGVERLVEVFQADGWAGWSSSPDEMLELYNVTCRARCCMPLAVTRNDIKAVRKNLLEITQQWQSIPVGKSLRLQF